ncbi:serine/threonine-protein kinase [Cnuibacter sp. UC19_7]|uniref:serine/threonine-protein kinase n=1 Tax=Cnuibacter sp. UC19_7 TaxID=3350166 RepID=UPI00366C110F
MNGDLFAGRFRLSGLLGTGGDASVYRAVDVRSGDDVAVKVLHPHLATETGFRERFLAQARLAAAVRAPGLVPVIAFGVDEEEGESAWLAMGVAPGGTLAERVRESGPLMVGDAVHLAREVLAALSAVHAAGLVHRDVTPSNVMVDGEGERMRAVLLDLGLAGRRGEAATVGRAADGAEGAGTTGSGSSGVRIQGTVDWMSPEHLSADPVDERGDVYQVGALLYFCVTGSRPFPRASAEEVLRAHRSAPPPIASVVAPGVPSVIDRVIVRAMLKRPADRYPSAEAMAEALTSATAALREESPTPGSTERMAVPLSGAEMAATRVLPAASRAVTAPRAAGAARGRTTAPRTSENTTRLVAASTTSRPGRAKLPRRRVRRRLWSWWGSSSPRCSGARCGCWRPPTAAARPRSRCPAARRLLRLRPRTRRRPVRPRRPPRSPSPSRRSPVCR